MLRAFRFAFCLLALGLFINTADAAILTYYLNGVTFNDGGTATGSFNFDPDAGTPCSTGASPCGVFSDVMITTTTGTMRTGATYTFVCGNGQTSPNYVPSCTGVSPDSTSVLTLTSGSANQTGLPGFSLFFTGAGAVPPAGLSADFNTYSETIDISNSSLAVGAGEEATCADAACTTPGPPFRSTVTGTVGSSETLLMYFFFN